MAHRRKSGHPRPSLFPTGPQTPSRTYNLTADVPEQIAQEIVFENGLGGGSASEFENIKQAAKTAFAAGNSVTAALADDSLRPRIETAIADLAFTAEEKAQIASRVLEVLHATEVTV